MTGVEPRDGRAGRNRQAASGSSDAPRTRQQHGEVRQHGVDPAARAISDCRPGSAQEWGISRASDCIASGITWIRDHAAAERPERQPEEHAQRRRLVARWSRAPRPASRPPPRRARTATISAPPRAGRPRRPRTRAPSRATMYAGLQQRDAVPAERLARDDRPRGRSASTAIRRDTPSCLASTSRPAAVSEVRNMNRISWVDAPNVNCREPGEQPRLPDLGDRRPRRPGTPVVARLGRGASAVSQSASASPATTRAAVAIAATLRDGGLDRRPEAGGQRVGRRRRTAPRPCRRPEPRGENPSGTTTPASSCRVPPGPAGRPRWRSRGPRTASSSAASSATDAAPRGVTRRGDDAEPRPRRARRTGARARRR